jgi:hypothetical protein
MVLKIEQPESVSIGQTVDEDGQKSLHVTQIVVFPLLYMAGSARGSVFKTRSGLPRRPGKRGCALMLCVDVVMFFLLPDCSENLIHLEATQGGTLGR